MPYVGLLVIVGSFGAFLITRDLSSRARATLNEQLLQSTLRARALLHEDELYLLESANLAANLDGMADAIRAGDEAAAARLLTSVLALKDELNVLALTSPDGATLVSFTRGGPAAKPRRNRTPTVWGQRPFVARALANANGDRTAGVAASDGSSTLSIAAPVCTGVEECAPVGVAIVGMHLDRLAEAAASIPGSATVGLSIFDADGGLLATAGQTPAAPTRVRIDGDALVRRTEAVGETEVQTLYVPFAVQGKRVGMIAASLPSDPVFASVRGAAARLVVILLMSLAGIVAVGALLSRFILRQTRPLLETNRALGAGDLSARAPVVSDDEIGELARGLNQMAEQLQASVETLELRVEQRTEEVQRLLRERTEFFASLSHELRTPIALIISHGEMLIDPDFRRTAKHLEERGAVIRDSGKHLLAVVNDILDLARLETGNVRVDITDIAPGSVVEELRPTFHGLSAAAGLTAEIDMPPELPMVRADPSRLRDILVNLIDNAVKYTPAGGSVTVRASAEAGLVSISVTDTGVGIAPEAQRHIFEPFFRVPGSETQHGQFSTGLGLAIAKRLAEAQSGDIVFESVAGAGSTFSVRLPAAGPVVSIEPVRRSAGRQARRGRAGGPRGRARGRAS